MSGTISKNKLWLIIALCIAMSLSTVSAFAWGGHGGGRYHYRGGRWYGPGWFGLEVAVSALAIGAVVEGLPVGYTTVVAGGIPYYYYGGYYYRSYPYGYVVVPAPVVATTVVAVPAATTVVTVPEAAPINVTQPQGKIITINVPNSNGSYTPVSLTKYKNGYIGPQGEYYEGHPTVEQLKLLYGN